MRRSIAASVVLVLVLVLSLLPDPKGPLAPRIANAATTSFAVISDYGSCSANEQSVAAMVNGWNPDFIVTAGDNWQGSVTNCPNYYASSVQPRYNTAAHPFVSNQAFWPVLGNHDYEATLARYRAYFTYLPTGTDASQRYYDIVRGDVHFFMLDSSGMIDNGSGAITNIALFTAQKTWLQNALAASTSPWNIVMLHFTPYTSGTSHPSYTNLQWDFAGWGADLVIDGHVHVYERIERSGINYLTVGLGGQSIVGFGAPVTGSQLRYNGNYGAMRVTATDATLDFEFITTDGLVRDSQHLSKALGARPAAPSRLAATSVSPSQTDLSWQDNAIDADFFKIERSPDGTDWETDWAQVGIAGPAATTYADAGLAGHTTYYYRVRAFSNASGNSDYSNVASAPTLATPSIHVADLAGVRPPDMRMRTVQVTITVHDGHHAPIAGAVVSGAWGLGASGSANCTTDSSGMCSVSKNNLKEAVAGVTWTVSNVGRSGYTYVGAANHDVDGDSNGRSIVVRQ